MSLNILVLSLFIITIITNQLRVLLWWYKTLYNNEEQSAKTFISFYFGRGWSRILPGDTGIPCLIFHPKDNTPETLSLVKKINRTVILINMLNIVLLGIIISTMTIVRK